jgi:hypothetical protein
MKSTTSSAYNEIRCPFPLLSNGYNRPCSEAFAIKEFSTSMTIMNIMGEREVQQTQVGHQLVMSGEAHVPRPSRQQEVQQTQVGQDPWLGCARGPGQ